MNKSLLVSPLVLSLVWLTGCGGSEGEDVPNTAAAMSAIGGQVAAPGSIEESPEVIDTKTLIVAEDFAFDTAQSIDIDFDIAAARNHDASVSVCTSFLQDEQGYDIDYDSCTVTGDLEGGIFSHSMEVTNEFESVVAVVWFQDSSMAPIHQEFTVAGSDNDRTVKSVAGNRAIVWR